MKVRQTIHRLMLCALPFVSGTGMPGIALAAGEEPLQLAALHTNTTSSKPKPVATTVADAIAAVQSEQGPYAAELGQLYTSLGMQLQQQQDHSAALEAFKSAMHVERINQGLYSTGQEVILAAMVESAVAMDDWELAQNFLGHWQWLATEHGVDGPEKFLQGVRQLASLHMVNYFGHDASVGGRPELHLLRANQLFTKALATLEQHYGTSDQAMVPWLYDLSVSAYYLSVVSVEKNRPIVDSKLEANDPATTLAAQKENFIIEQYNSGREAIERMVTIEASDGDHDFQSLFDAEIMLADWYMLYNRPESARKQYRKAYHTLFENLQHDSDNGNEIVRLPVDLPNLNQAKDLEQEPAGDYAVFRYNVSWRGNASEVEVVETSIDNQRALAALKNSLLNRKYRPKLIDGEPVDATGVVKRYPLPATL
ncbi:hypothetical protein [Halioxenophilus sp. WMMB6]|uniref:hypothetical protein n=1 Tax=Halioxenophilus sp. WMMB6 TaxID=3073815 RepID=UPI00295ED5A8|nr:hypothetical protein [Halioxenophilus sp. WMMB6]